MKRDRIHADSQHRCLGDGGAWVTVERIAGTGGAHGLLGVRRLDDIEWRAEVIELFEAGGMTIALPEE